MFFKKATIGENHILLYVLGIVALFIGMVIGQGPLTIVQYLQVEKYPELGTEEVDLFLETMDFSIIHIDKNFGFLLMILSFVGGMLAFMLAVKYLHKRPFKYLITPKFTIDYQKILFSFGFWIVMALIFESILMMIYPEVYFMDFKPMKWIILVFICILLLPIQTSLEELVFRGYLMPGLAVFLKNKWMPLILTSILFGLVHGFNPEVERFGFWTMMIYYVGAGLFLGLITVLDDSLELALGVHAATNVFGAAFFSFEGSVIQTDSIFKATEVNPLIMIFTFFLSAAIFIFVCNKKYKWGGLKRLYSEIDSNFDTANDDSALDSEIYSSIKN